MKKSPFHSVSRFAKLLLRKSRSKKTPTKKKKKSKKNNNNCDGKNSNFLSEKIKTIKSPIQFFKTILHHDEKNIIPTGDITKTTKEFFKEFFEKFQAVKFDLPTMTQQSVFNRTRKLQLFDHIDDTLRESVEKQMETTFTYSVHIGRPINISISVNSGEEDTVIHYVKMILFWLHIVTQYTTKTTCSNGLSIYLMLSDLKKILKSPECTSSADSGKCIIEKTSVNTGFSNKCSHIVIYRKEEWFKVFIHETIHNYGLDFSFRRQTEEENILNYFGITSHKFQVRLYEAYTESWARIMNALLHAFNQEHKDFDKFMMIADQNIQLERLNAYFQTAKILNYMKLDIDNLKDYNEETSNLSYYFIVCMLYSDYQDYIVWSRENNKENILQFDNSLDNQQEIYFNYIKKCHRSAIFKNNLKYFKDSILKMEMDKDDYLRTYMKKSLLNEKSILEFNFLA